MTAEHFEILHKYPEQNECDSDDGDIEKFTCVCSENTCSYFMIIIDYPL
jgi:hypothetical protein